MQVYLTVTVTATAAIQHTLALHRLSDEVGTSQEKENEPDQREDDGRGAEEGKVAHPHVPPRVVGGVKDGARPHAQVRVVLHAHRPQRERP